MALKATVHKFQIVIMQVLVYHDADRGTSASRHQLMHLGLFVGP